MNKLIAVLLVSFSFNAYAVDGMNSLLIGHSFFKPYAELMPDYSGAAGIAGHTQTIVYSGGATGTPEALWNNTSKKNTITAALDGGDIELFGMTYHPDYPTTTGYVNWINYALDKNPSQDSLSLCLGFHNHLTTQMQYTQQSGKHTNPTGIHSLTN